MENATGTLTLDTLPDYCLEYIFYEVGGGLKTEIQISKVCTRFQDIFARMWRRYKYYHRVYITWEFSAFYLCTDDFTYFLPIVHTAIREIALKCDLVQRFLYVIKKQKIESFPNLDTLEIMVGYPSRISLPIELFPKLKILKIPLDFIGSQKGLCKQVQEIHLIRPYEDNDWKILSKIFKDCTQLKLLDISKGFLNSKPHYIDLTSIDKCQQLQVLILDSRSLRPVLNKVMELPSLKKLKVYQTFFPYTDRVKDFYDILENQSHKISGIAINNAYMGLKPHWHDNLKIFESNILRKIAFVPDKDDLLEQLVNVKQLNILVFLNNSYLRSTEVLNILASCPEMEYMYLNNYMHVNEDFFNGAVSILRSLKERRSLLTVRCLKIWDSSSKCFMDIKKHPSYLDWTTVMVLSREVPEKYNGLFDYQAYTIEFEQAVIDKN